MPTLALFRRLPMLRWRPRVDEQIVPPTVQVNYSAFAEDFTFLERELTPHFRDLDNAALRTQNQFRLEQVIMICGGTIATVLGALQAALASAIWPGIAEAILAIMLAAIAQRARALKAHDRYFTDRLKAETLRGEYFLFLGRVGPYADNQYRMQHLIRRVAEVVAGGGER